MEPAKEIEKECPGKKEEPVEDERNYSMFFLLVRMIYRPFDADGERGENCWR